MIRSIIIASLLTAGGITASTIPIGYSSAGQKYIKKQQHVRKSVRPGSMYYGSRGGFRGGK